MIALLFYCMTMFQSINQSRFFSVAQNETITETIMQPDFCIDAYYSAIVVSQHVYILSFIAARTFLLYHVYC